MRYVAELNYDTKLKRRAVIFAMSPAPTLYLSMKDYKIQLTKQIKACKAFIKSAEKYRKEAK